MYIMKSPTEPESMFEKAQDSVSTLLSVYAHKSIWVYSFVARDGALFLWASLSQKLSNGAHLESFRNNKVG